MEEIGVDLVGNVEVIVFPVGTIIASMLSQADFSNNYGADWVLADGREISTQTSYYKILGKKQIPDLRGMFLRGLNEDREDGMQDIDDARVAGDMQIDTFQGHFHGFEHAPTSAAHFGNSVTGNQYDTNLVATPAHFGKESHSSANYATIKLSLDRSARLNSGPDWLIRTLHLVRSI